MNKKVYESIVRKAVTDPVVRSGMKLASRLNLFQAMAQRPLAPRALATELHLKERYVWELSQAMLATQVMTMNREGELSVPPEHLKMLLEATEKATWEPHLLNTLPILDKCFPEDGKSGYTLDEAPYVLELVNKTRAPYTSKLVESLIKNMGLYHPDKLTHVLDVGCGTGDITIPLAKGIPGVSVIGCDMSEQAIIAASIASKGVSNLTFAKVDGGAYQGDWMRKFDAVLMFDVLHDLPHPEQTITEIKKVLKDDGILVMIDPDVSSDPMNNVGNLRAANALVLSSFYCVPSSCCHAHSSALGVSWGREGKARFLEQMGLTVKNRVSLLDSLFFHTFICVKSPSTEEKKK